MPQNTGSSFLNGDPEIRLKRPSEAKSNHQRWVRTRTFDYPRVPQVTGPSSGHWIPLLEPERQPPAPSRRAAPGATASRLRQSDERRSDEARRSSKRSRRTAWPMAWDGRAQSVPKHHVHGPKRPGPSVARMSFDPPFDHSLEVRTHLQDHPKRRYLDPMGGF